jgi:GT2 family glycosyltransferase
MSTVTVVITAHNTDVEPIVTQVFEQTRQPQAIVIVMSDQFPDLLPEGFSSEHEVTLVLDRNRNDWGHHKRHLGLMLAETDYVTFWNADDSYDPTFLEKLMAAVEGNDVAFCSYVHKTGSTLGSEFRGCNSTSGNFLVNTRLAKEVDWFARVYDADAQFIDAVKARTNRVIHVPEILYWHK